MNTYTYATGEQVELKEIASPSGLEKCFKISLPSTEEGFDSGEGEGVWACADESVFAAWEADEEGVFFVRILNDSVYYPTLKCNTVLPVEFRKGQRPVAFYEELLHHHGPSKRDEVIQFLTNARK